MLRLPRRIGGGGIQKVQYIWDSTCKTRKQYPKDVRFLSSLGASDGMPHIPPPFLRYRVSSNYDIEAFHKSGLDSHTCFESALEGIWRSFFDFRSILDFGTGCSRIMRWMKEVSRHAELYGTDIDKYTDHLIFTPRQT